MTDLRSSALDFEWSGSASLSLSGYSHKPDPPQHQAPSLPDQELARGEGDEVLQTDLNCTHPKMQNKVEHITRKPSQT